MPMTLRKHVAGSITEKDSDQKEVRKSNEGSHDSASKVKPGLETKSDAPRRFSLTWRKVVLRMFLCIAIILLVYNHSNKSKEPIPFAGQKEKLQLKTQEVPCSNDYRKDTLQFSGCSPVRCGRFVTDDLLTVHETAALLQLAKKGLALGGGKGGASILDLHSGALSQGPSFVNVYKLIKDQKFENIFTHEDFEMYRSVKNKIHRMVAMHFGLQPKNIYLTHPTFFSCLTDMPPVNIHDQYWHVHVDKETYESFHYTSLLYLSDYEVDFQGGRFHFVGTEQNVTIEPKIGRVSAFTSGSENPHYVERVKGGKRYALTVSFTCNKKFAISTPTVSKVK